MRSACRPNYKGVWVLKFLVRENGSGRIDIRAGFARTAVARSDRILLSSVLLSSQLVPVEISSEVETKAQGVRARLTESPLEMSGEKIVPSVARYFTQRADALHLLSRLLSGKIRQGR